ncbi:MAG: response regulator [Candidatus Sericytochromatia bacterium]
MTTVLVVEDSSVIQKMLTTVLEKDKTIQVVGAVSDGQAAVEKTQELRPDIVLMDYRLPKQNAPEAIKQIMSQFPTPILVITSIEPAEEKRKEVMALGAVGFLEKPKSMDYNSIAVKLLTQIKTLSRIKPARRSYP